MTACGVKKKAKRKKKKVKNKVLKNVKEEKKKEIKKHTRLFVSLVPCISSYARLKLPQAIQIFVVVFCDVFLEPINSPWLF